jgi:hypothetical protein
MKKTVFITLLFITVVYSQSKVKPSKPSGIWNNTVNFDFINNVYEFNYTSNDETLSYRYAANSFSSYSFGTLYGLTCTINNKTPFVPATGGLDILGNNRETQSWECKYTLLESKEIRPNVLALKFKMSHPISGDVIFTYTFHIYGRTLIIQPKVVTGIGIRFNLDRCDRAINPVIINVPYLTMTNILYTDGIFTSMYFDWEKTNASIIRSLESFTTPTRPNSVYYAQSLAYRPLTNGTYNNFNETIYLTVSPSIVDVLPNLTNPISPYKNESGSRLVSDHWESPFSTVNNKVQSLYDAGINSLWVINHDWQNAGYDNKYPDILPANASYGNDTGLVAVSKNIRDHGDLFSAHENYVDFYPDAPSWNPNAIAKNSDGSFVKGWFHLIQSYQMKHSLAANYLNSFASSIHTALATNSSFLDVHSSINPSSHVDYDASVINAGKFSEALKNYRNLGPLMRAAHQGPVSGEGYNHMLFVGYYDDIAAGINTGGQAKGHTLPLLVDFDLFKMHEKAVVHGVGYYERFWYDATPNGGFIAYPKEKVLEYIATEIAYGHAGFIPTPARLVNYIEAANLEFKHVFSAQKQYVNAKAISILYHDNMRNEEISSSEYIRRYPTTFNQIDSPNFMGQVKITYDNGTIVCVNRNQTKTWQLNIGISGSFFNYNAIINGKKIQYIGNSNTTDYLLPAINGWVVYAPQENLNITSVANKIKNTKVYPNPVIQDIFSIKVTNQTDDNCFITIFSSIGLQVYHGILHREEVIQLNKNNFKSGLYYIKVHNNYIDETTKIIIE